MRLVLKEDQRTSNDLATFPTLYQTNLEREMCSSGDFKVNAQAVDTSVNVTENKRTSHA